MEVLSSESCTFGQSDTLIIFLVAFFVKLVITRLKKKKGKNTCGQWFFLNNYVFKEYENYFECENWQWDLFLNTLRKCLTKLLILPFSFNRLCQELYNWKRSRLQRDNICHQKWYSVSGLELNDSPWAQVRVQQQRQWE